MPGQKRYTDCMYMYPKVIPTRSTSPQSILDGVRIVENRPGGDKAVGYDMTGQFRTVHGTHVKGHHD